MSTKPKISIKFPGFGTFSLFSLLLVLKLLGKIDISWFWVVAPLWLPFVIFLTVVGVMGLIVFIGAFVVAWLEDKKRW